MIKKGDYLYSDHDKDFKWGKRILAEVDGGYLHLNFTFTRTNLETDNQEVRFSRATEAITPKIKTLTPTKNKVGK